GEQRKRDVVFRRELRLAALVENADAEHRRLIRRELRQGRLERARLLRAAGRIVLRIEIENDRAAAVIRQRVRGPGLILQRERRLFPAWLDERHGHSLPRPALL